MKEIINNLIDNIKSIPCKYNVDLVLDGGAFNGSYMIGSLLYLKEIEYKKFVKIDRISGCSIGSLLGCLYIADLLYLHESFYKAIRESLVNGNLKSYSKVLHKIKSALPENFYILCNQKLYITFFNIHTNKQIVVKSYENNAHLFQCIYRSSFLPFLMNGNLCYKNKYIDGFYPYIFKETSYKSVLFIDLMQQNVIKMLFIKNEINNSERIMKGILETHSYFFSDSSFTFISDVYSYKLINMIKIVIYKIRKLVTHIIVTILQNYYIYSKSFTYKNEIESITKNLLKLILQYNLT